VLGSASSARQLLTLSTAILALTRHDREGRRDRRATAPRVGMGSFLASMVFGVFAMFALWAGPRPSEGEVPPSVATARVRAPAFLQIGAFVVGTTFLLLFGVSALE
jgi:hypothetical protein